MASNKRKVNPDNLPYFPFYAAAWIGSGTVDEMSMAERGIYSTLMAYNWLLGDIPWDIKGVAKLLHIHNTVAERFLKKFGILAVEVQKGCRRYYLPHLLNFSETVGKSKGRPPIDKGDKEDKSINQEDGSGDSPIPTEVDDDIV
jgi:hypothetical protein